MPNITVRVEGADELRAVLLRARDVFLPQDLRWAHEHAAEVVVDAAGPNVPRRSGALKNSLRATGTAKSGFAKTSLPYAAAIHWGRKTGNVGRPSGNHPGLNVIRGRPFLVDAATRSRAEITDQFEAAMRKLVAKIG